MNEPKQPVSLDRADLIADLDAVVTGLARISGINETTPLADGAYTLQYDEWDWEIGVGLYGLYRHADATDDPALIEALTRWYDWQIGRGLPPRQVNSSSPMLALSCLAERAHRPDWDSLIVDWATWLMNDLPRTEDSGFQHVVKERPNTGQLWDDTLFMTCLFLAHAGTRFGRRDWTDEAVHQFLVHTRYLSDPVTGLWYHGWTFEGRHNFARAFWGRGNAWVTIAIPELFSLLPDLDGPDRLFLTSVFRQQVTSLSGLQNADGFFHTLLDDPTSPIEASATAGIAYGISRGIDLGMLDNSRAGAAKAAFDAVRRCIGADGIVAHVSDGTPMGPDLDFYRRIPDIPAPYGQALTMLMLVERLAKVPDP